MTERLSEAAREELERRVGALYLRQRQGIQRDHVAQIFGRGRNFFHIENWYSVHALIRGCLRFAGVYGRGRRNSANIRLRRNRVPILGLPSGFEGFSLLQLSDLHLEMSPCIVQGLIAAVQNLSYDVCVITGDFRARTYGSYDETLEILARVRRHLKAPVYAVLGNHDFIEMVPGMEALNLRVLLNESVALQRGEDRVFLAGIDDPHYYRVDNLEKAAAGIPWGSPSILLSHSPEVFRHAAHAGFDLMLCGHTHGGQICLPGGAALTYNAACPRRLGAGAWRHHAMRGYTSVGAGSCVVDTRFNCPPEVTLHTLCADAGPQ